MLYTCYRRPDRPEHKGFEVSVTEQAHVNVHQQLERMMRAGEVLRRARLEQYDFQDGVDDGRDIPYRSTGFDMADASEIIERVEADVRDAQVRAMAIKNTRRAKGSVSEGSGGAEKTDNAKSGSSGKSEEDDT